MPLFEYTCDSCQSEFELLVRGSEKPACPSCDSKKLTKQLSVPAAHMGGSSELPVCSTPSQMPSGGCGAPQCGMGGCQFE